MINEILAKIYCREDISKIENYDKAIADTTQVWDCHHRDEVRVLPSEMTAIRSRQDLKECGRYYGCPANELIFLTHSEHSRLHMKGKLHSDETRMKISESMKGKLTGRTLSEEHRRKISESNKGQVPWIKGKTLTEETRRKISESMKGKKRGQYRKTLEVGK